MCDTVVARTDDGVLFAKNSDRDPNEAQRLTWHAAADHAAEAQVRCTWSTIPQARHTYAVLLSRPWWMWGAEMGANEHGVVIGNEAVFTRRAPRRETGTELLGMDLLRLALERAATAADAVSVLIDLLERHGQGGACSAEHPSFHYDNGFLVADPTGAFVVETAGMAHAVEEVRGRARSISNGLTIPSFARTYADPLRGAVARHTRRSAMTARRAEAATGPADLVAALRDHGGAGPSYAALSGALGAPCAHAGGLLTSTQTTASWVADLRSGVAGADHWVTATSAPCLSTFVPVRVTDPVPELTGPDGLRNRFDPAHRWWRHEVLHRAALRDPARAVARFAPERDALEHRWFHRERPALAEALEMVEGRERRWLAALLDVPESRPRWLRRLWSGWDRSAQMPAASAP